MCVCVSIDLIQRYTDKNRQILIDKLQEADVQVL